MDNRIWIGIVAVLAIAFGGSAYAHGGFAMDDAQYQGMHRAMDQGTYEDFLELQEQGLGPAWIDNEEDFEAWQEHHELMEQRAHRFHGHGMMRGYGMHGGGNGCPAWN